MDLITQKEAAQMMRKSEATLARLRREGELPFIPGRPIRFHVKDIEKYIANQTVRKRPPAKGRGRKHGMTDFQRGMLKASLNFERKNTVKE